MTTTITKIRHALRPKLAAEKLGISLNTLWCWHRERPSFPRGIKLGPGTTVFWEDELEAFAAAQGQ